MQPIHPGLPSRLIILYVIVFSLTLNGYGQVRIRLFSSFQPESVLFTVNEGSYEISGLDNEPVIITKGKHIIVSRLNGRMVVKTAGNRGFLCDSLEIKGRTGRDKFSIRMNDRENLRQNYSGDLVCCDDLGTIVLINICDIDSYIAGVVRTEGGSGKNIEFFKTQAVIVRTYMYKYFNKHVTDMYNLCDNTHCQAFNGITEDPVINRAVLETKDEVILDHDITLITSVFHSNCGGETIPAGFVWLADQSYLKGVKDPFCVSSPNASWSKTISFSQWLDYLRRSGFEGDATEKSSFSFHQDSRKMEYMTGKFTLPLNNIRTDLGLRSSFFSVIVKGDSIILEGKGYGHGVGLCQEGAMVMAGKGYDYRKIIGFYYSDIIITDIKNPIIPRGDNQVISSGAEQ